MSDEEFDRRIGPVDPSRRAFLRKMAATAFAVPVVVSFNMVGAVAVDALTPNQPRPGWGYGDLGHLHTGPPGQE